MGTTYKHVAFYGYLLGTLDEVEKFPELAKYSSDYSFDTVEAQEDIEKQSGLDMYWDGCCGECVLIGKKLAVAEEYEPFDLTALGEQDLSTIKDTPFADRLKDVLPRFYVFTEVH